MPFFKLQNHFTRDQVALMNVGTIGLQEFRDDAARAVPSFGNRIAAGQDQRCSHPQSSKRESVGKHKNPVSGVVVCRSYTNLV